MVVMDNAVVLVVYAVEFDSVSVGSDGFGAVSSDDDGVLSADIGSVSVSVSSDGVASAVDVVVVSSVFWQCRCDNAFRRRRRP